LSIQVIKSFLLHVLCSRLLVAFVVYAVGLVGKEAGMVPGWKMKTPSLILTKTRLTS